MSENPIATLAGGGSTIRVPNQLGEVSTGGVAAQGLANVFGGVETAAKEVNEYIVLEDARDAADEFITEEDRDVLTDAEGVLRKNRSASTGISSKASSALRIDAAFKTMTADNPHLAAKLQAIKSPVEGSKRYMLGLAENQGAAAARQTWVTEANQYAAMHGKSGDSQENKDAAYGAKKREEALHESTMASLNLEAAQATDAKAKQRITTTTAITMYTKENKDIDQTFRNSMALGKEAGIALLVQLAEAEGPESRLRHLIPSFADAKDDDSYRLKVKAAWVGILEARNIQIQEEMAVSKGIVDPAQAKVTMQPYLDVQTDKIEMLKGGNVKSLLENHGAVEDINTLALLIGKYPKLAQAKVMAEKFSKLMEAGNKTTGGIGVFNTMGVNVTKVLGDLMGGKVPENPTPDKLAGKTYNEIVKTLSGSVAQAAASPKATPDEVEAGVDVATGLGANLKNNNKELTNQGLRLPLFKDFFKILSTPAARKKYLSTIEGREDGAILPIKYVNELFEPQFTGIMNEEIGLKGQEPLKDVEGGHPTLKTAQMWIPEAKVDVRSDLVTRSGTTYNIAPDGLITFVVDSRVTFSVDELFTLEKRLSVVNVKAGELHSAVKLGAEAINIDPKLYAEGVARHVLNIKPPAGTVEAETKKRSAPTPPPVNNGPNKLIIWNKN